MYPAKGSRASERLPVGRLAVDGRPLGVSVGIWCPQGRARLPLSAQLLLRQIPADTTLWNCEGPFREEAPAETPAVWVVLCAGIPPAPPKWRNALGAPVLLFPGRATQWTEDTRQAAEAWRPVLILSDLLPDETDSPLWHDWWRSAEMAWLPPVMETGAERVCGTQIAIAIGPDFPRWLADAVVPALANTLEARLVPIPAEGNAALDALGRLQSHPGRILWCTSDPIIGGLALAEAGRTGRGVVFWGDPGSGARWALAGRESGMRHPLPRAGEQLGSVLRDLVRDLRLDPDQPAARTKHFDLGALLERAAGEGSEAGDETFDRFAELRVFGSERAAAGDTAAVCPRAVRKAIADASAGTRADLLRAIAATPADALMGTIACCERLVPDWWEHADSLCDDRDTGRVGSALFNIAGDGQVAGIRREKLEMASRLLTLARKAEPNTEEWMLHAATLAAVLGDFPAAQAALERLATAARAQTAWVLQLVLRAWLPELEGAMPSLVPRGGGAWWLEQADRAADAGILDRAYAARGALLMGDEMGARERFARNALSIQNLAPVVVTTWLAGHGDTASSWWREQAGRTVRSGTPADFWLLAAERLCGSPTHCATELASFSPEWFAATRPSHPRCFVRAVLHRADGDEPAAARWHARALAEDSLARFRNAAWERAAALKS